LPRRARERLLRAVAEGRRIVAFGDSLTAAPRSWAEVLGAINLGIPGDTTVHLVSRFAEVVARGPDLLVVLAGTNDARRHGADGSKMLVPDSETEANLELLATLAREQTAARTVFITPPPILEDKIRRAPLLRREAVSWLAEDVARKAAIVAALDCQVIDSRAVLKPPLDALLLADGLHLSARGQLRLARWVLRCLDIGPSLHRRACHGPRRASLRASAR
jgi:lysophospholipase L1-like esterase